MLKVVKKHWFNLGIIGIVIIVSYIGVFGNDFVWDDRDFIVHRQDIRSFDVIAFLKGSLPEGHEGVWRPLRTMLYATSYKIWGTDAVGYHVQAVVFHIITTFLVYSLAWMMSRKEQVAFVTAMLFGIHPVQVESVVFMTASFDMLGAMLYFLTCIACLYAARRRSILRTVIATVVFILALLSSEFALTLPVMIVLLHWYKWRRTFSLKTLASRVWIYFAVEGLYLVIRFGLLNVLPRENQFSSLLVLWTLMLKAIAKYITLLFFPLVLTVNHKLTSEAGVWQNSLTTPTWTSYIDVTAVVGFLLLFTAILLFLLGRRRIPQVTFAVMWFFVALTPVLNIIPASTPFAERYLYIPSFGYCFGIGLFTYVSLTKMKQKKLIVIERMLIGVFLIACIGLGLRTFVRVFDWKSSLTLWKSAADVSDQSSLVQNNLGKALLEQGQTDEAVEAFKHALIIHPAHTNAAVNLAVILKRQERYEEALSVLVHINSQRPDNTLVLEHLADLYNNTQDYQNAEQMYLQLLEHKNSPLIWNKLGLLYVGIGDVSRAERAFIQAIQVDEQFASAYNNLAVVYLSQKRLSEAIILLEDAAQKFPDDQTIMENLVKAKDAQEIP